MFVTKRGNSFVVGYNEKTVNAVSAILSRLEAPMPYTPLRKRKWRKFTCITAASTHLPSPKRAKSIPLVIIIAVNWDWAPPPAKYPPQLVRSLSSRRVPCAASSYHHSSFLCDDGSLFSVGRNDCGQLGQGDCIDKKLPKQVTSPLGRT